MCIRDSGTTVHIQGVALHAPNAPLSGHNDHRIVMALAVAAIASGLPALLCGAEAVDKSWPAFWSVLREMCIRDRLKRTRAIYRALGLPTRAGANKEKVLAYMQHDKKARGDHITVIKCPGLGCWRADSLPMTELPALLGME